MLTNPTVAPSNANLDPSRKPQARIEGTRSNYVDLPVNYKGRKVVAKTCFDCDELLMADQFHQKTASCKNCHRRTDWARTKLPPKPAGRLVLAATCKGCGLLLMASKFNNVAKWHLCLDCERAHHNARRTRRRKTDPKYAARVRSEGLRLVSREQARSLKVAKRHGYIWTGPELEYLVTHDSMTAAQLAEVLQRTYRAVSMMRTSVRRDPRKAAMAGVRSRADVWG